MKHVFTFFLLFISILTLSAQELTSQQYKTDFEYLWQKIQEDYCYWDKKQTDWGKVRQYYSPIFDTISSKRSFVLMLEKVLNEVYDHHVSLSTNTMESQRLVPTGTDLWAAYKNGKPMITEVRPGFGGGLKAGMELVSFNGIEIEKAILAYMPISLMKKDKEAKDFALRVLLAGKFIDDRKISVKDGDRVKDFFPDRPISLLSQHSYKNEIESQVIANKIGYIRINNRLWDNNLIPLFDSVLAALQHTSSMILDLRETPSGGNTTVARAILGSFINKEGFYQRHELTTEERNYGIKRSWMEIVSPRKSVYTKPMVVLVNHWTGSVGEGITIGFDALKRATIIGSSMAGLNGAIYSYQMPNTKIGFSFPVEKLFHINQLPRENFVPEIMPDLTKQKTGKDVILETAIQYLQSRLK